MSGLESVVLQHEDALDSMGDGDTHLSVPLFVLLLSFTLADLGRLLLRRWRARGATARLVRLAAYAIEEEQVRDAAAALYVIDHGGGQRAGGGGEKSGRPRDGERAADGGPLRLLNGATETHFLLRIVLMPLVLLLSLTSTRTAQRPMARTSQRPPPRTICTEEDAPWPAASPAGL